MNRIEEMIKEMCPDGVKWVKLGEVASVEKEKNKNHITENAYSITQKGLICTKDFFKEKTHVTSSDTKGYYIVQKDWFVYSPSRIDVGSINYLRIDGPVIVSPIDVVFSINKNLILPEYLYQYLTSGTGMFNILKFREGVEGTGRRSLPFCEIAKVQIPLPPLPIQQEIVKILDSFTALQQNLEDELKLRQKQYEHYREKLLTFEDGEVEWKKLGDCCIVNRGVRVVKRDLLSQGQYPVFQNSLLPMGFLDKTNVPGDSVYVITAGSSSGSVGYQKNPFWAADDCVYIIPNENIYARYIWHFLIVKERNIKANVRQGAMPRLPRNIIESLEIPIPSKHAQLQITQTLDHFESLISNLKTEIELRKKQYEYYREKLLTF